MGVKTEGVGEWESGDAETETGGAQVGGGPRAKARYSGTNTGDSQVGGGHHEGAGAGEMAGLGASEWDDRGRSGDRGRGGAIEADKEEV